MTTATLTRAAKRWLGRHEPHEIPPVHGVADAEWYDAAYKAIDVYKAPYWDSHYYALWCVLSDRVRRSGATRVLDIGCGPGQLAACLFDLAEIREYTGLDFSPHAVTMAQQACPKGAFLVGDATTTDLHQTVSHDITICTEVLEHVPDDLGMLSRFTGRCLCTVPNFPYDSHVRHFANTAEVEARYGAFFTACDVWAIPGHHAAHNIYFLIDGVRRT
jgi:SAM-dependent methyltransferase